jgi:serine/threonine-protein kinase Chk1
VLTHRSYTKPAQQDRILTTYSSVRKAVPPKQSYPVIAVKLIHKEHAFRQGRLRPKQIELELAHHAQVCPHQNIIKFLATGSDENWIWLALELAEGGDLFDKIEADEGVGAEVAHMYFTQLVAAVGWCHGKGVAHRDIKPENVLLSASGDLKLADFGLATQFMEPKTGKKKLCAMVCGSPPYIAPEILAVGNMNLKRKTGEDGEKKLGYDPSGADVWSCAIVLFVLLAGNTPWDQPLESESWEYAEYIRSKGKPEDELWNKVPPGALPLITGMLSVEPSERLSLAELRKNPWFRQRNPYLDDHGKAKDQVGLATHMLERMHIDFSQEVTSSQSQREKASQASQQPNPLDIPTILKPGFEWEAPPILGSQISQLTHSQAQRIPASQLPTMRPPPLSNFLATLGEDPIMSQFSSQPAVPNTLTQAARQFSDIMPASGLSRFYSTLPPPEVLRLIFAAMEKLSIPLPVLHPSVLDDPFDASLNPEQRLVFGIHTVDTRLQPLHGSLIVDQTEVSGHALVQVYMPKGMGDPIGWRRLFKQVTVLCREGVVQLYNNGPMVLDEQF